MVRGEVGQNNYVISGQPLSLSGDFECDDHEHLLELLAFLLFYDAQQGLLTIPD